MDGVLMALKRLMNYRPVTLTGTDDLGNPVNTGTTRVAQGLFVHEPAPRVRTSSPRPTGG